MEKFFTIYHNKIPEFLLEFANVSQMLRLKNIGMNCGCEYTSFKKFDNIKKYSRYEHSVNVALIIWHFTNDIKQAVSGLLHDIATPVFAHTIDFLNGDYEKQSSTEERTREIIANSDEIVKLLTKYKLSVDDVCDYHIYPIADNDAPKLSADRLEYSLGNMVNYGFCSFEDARSFYADIIVGINECGESELIFNTVDLAVEFTLNVLKNSRLYISDEDRFSMQKLADIVKFAIDKNIIVKEDLYTTESYVIDKLMEDKITKKLWERYSNFSNIGVSRDNTIDNNKYTLDINFKKDIDEGICECNHENSDRELLNILYSPINVGAKKRYIDPFVKDYGRVNEISKKAYNEINHILDLDFNVWIYEK